MISDHPGAIRTPRELRACAEGIKREAYRAQLEGHGVSLQTPRARSSGAQQPLPHQHPHSPGYQTQLSQHQQGGWDSARHPHHANLSQPMDYAGQLQRSWQSSDPAMPRTIMARPNNVNRQPPQPPPFLQLRVSSAGGAPPTEYSNHQLPARVPLPLHSMHPDMQQGKDAEILSKSFDAISKLASSPAYIPTYPPPAPHQPLQRGLASPWSGGVGVRGVQYMNPPRPVAASPYVPTQVPLPMGTGPQHMGMHGAGSVVPRKSKAHVTAPADAVDTVALLPLFYFDLLLCEQRASSQAAE
jgi:hypothetical protein